MVNVFYNLVTGKGYINKNLIKSECVAIYGNGNDIHSSTITMHVNSVSELTEQILFNVLKGDKFYSIIFTATDTGQSDYPQLKIEFVSCVADNQAENYSNLKTWQHKPKHIDCIAATEYFTRILQKWNMANPFNHEIYWHLLNYFSL